jgi:hypothetical protein
VHVIGCPRGIRGRREPKVGHQKLTVVEGGIGLAVGEQLGHRKERLFVRHYVVPLRRFHLAGDDQAALGVDCQPHFALERKPLAQENDPFRAEGGVA